MHSTAGQTSSTVSQTPHCASSASTKTTTNIEQYHYPPISTLRRPSRPSNIDLSVFDMNNSSQSSDPGIYSAPICHLKQSHNTNHHQQQQQQHSHQMQQSSLILSPHPHTATFHYQPQQQQQQQHIQLPSHHHQHQQQHNIHQYQQQSHHIHQQQHMIDPFSQHQHTPHTFPLQASSNHYQHYFHFPPSSQNLGTTNNSTPPAYNPLTLQANVSNSNVHSPLNHRSNPVASSSAAAGTNSSQPSTPTHNSRLLAVQIQEQPQQQWSNPVLSPFMVKRINDEGNVVSSMSIDDDEDPSASIDALVADVDSSLLDDQQNKSGEENKSTSAIPIDQSRANTTSSTPHLYLRGTSHILTTPPNPLASNDHPDNHLTVGSNFQKTFSPIHSAGFELTTNHTVQLSAAAASGRTSYFTFDTNVLKENDLKSHLNDEIKQDTEQPLMINTDERLNIMSTNTLNQNDDSNQSSTDSNSQNSSSRTFSQILSSSEKHLLSSSSTDMTLSSLSQTNNTTNNKLPNTTTSTTTMSSSTAQQQANRHYCTHPDCTKAFANKSALAKHKLTHCQDRKHKCSKCNKGFKRLDHLHGHMLTHEEEKPHKCRVPDCNRTYCDARSLKRHIENAHQNILAAIHEGGHEEYRNFLPETAFVKAKELSSDFSIDSVDRSSPRSLSMDNEQPFHTSQQHRASSAHKILPTYTFDEEKYVECHICKKSFKNGAALNGHMRLHGGFNDKPSLSSSVDTQQKKKRVTNPTNIDRRHFKRKRPNSPLTSNDPHSRSLSQSTMPIKNEEEDTLMMSSSSSSTPNTTTDFYQQSMYPTLPPCSDVLNRSYDRQSLPSRIRSISSSVIQHETTPMVNYTIRNPMSVQPVSKTRKQISSPLNFYDKNNNHNYEFQVRANEQSANNRLQIPTNTNGSFNLPNGILRFDHLTNPDILLNPAPMHHHHHPYHHHDDRMRKTLSADETLKYYNHDRQANGPMPSTHSHATYFRSASTQHYPSHFPQIAISHATPNIHPHLLQQFLYHSNDLINKELYAPRMENLNPQHHPIPDESIRYTPATSPYSGQLFHSPSPRIAHSPGDKILNPTPSLTNTPVASPYPNLNASHCSPSSSSNDMCNTTTINNNNNNNNAWANNSRQSSPSTNSTSSHAVLKKRILSALKYETQDEQQTTQISQDCSPSTEQNTDQEKQHINLENSSEDSVSSLLTTKTVSSSNKSINEKPKQTISGFLITSPSPSILSTTTTITSSSTSTSSTRTHFNYEEVPLTTQTKPPTTENNCSFQWPSQVSQFRRQQNLSLTSQTSNHIPSTPYTPPPMLSPFRKGPGLYYQVFSQTTPATQQTTTVPTPAPPCTPMPDEISGPKINIGSEYQAIIPELQSTIDTSDIEHDEMLFSPSHMLDLDEQSLEKYEQLSRTNPLLFSQRHSPALYPIELVYMLLHEYRGDLQRTLATLLDGTAHDIKQCRPLHRYHFPECDVWTKEEIDAFTKAIHSSEKNFLLVSRAVKTKTIKQCIEFHYMPKVHRLAREAGINSLTIKRKRLQMLKTKQQKQHLDDETSLFNEFRSDDDSLTVNGDTTVQFSCDIDNCMETFASERAYRAHRNDHRRLKTNVTPPTNMKRNRHL